MALMHCPKCDKKISDKAESCQFCQHVLVADPEKIESERRINRIKKSSNLMTQSFIALILFIGGLAYTAWYTDDGTSNDKIIAQVVTAISFVWYLVTRIRIMLFKRSKQ
ncbi:zinc ribbon domain-containing protein [Catenovulum sp. 2E275]|uniref:zinc ribbon domain-containing protein n=1 Tax=Catenovulum sp. 2E275 TaxID=2980497 RepID=UPI0021CFF908|nr:zinc ribbon domain-containing protein [Catenovulum sp. 2E275]MCU4677164.1 zinc ribbon domain-containing protein [Catenovulum sp. 2E275]